MRCFNHDCRKRLPEGIRFCPYCGTPVIGAFLPTLPPRWQQNLLLVTLASSVVIVFSFLGMQLWDLVQPSPETHPVVLTATVPPTSTATRTPFPKWTALPTATPTPPPTPTNVMVRMVTPVMPASVVYGTVKEVVSLWAAPSYESQRLGEFFSGQQLHVLGKKPGNFWLYVEAEGRTGWVSAELVTLNMPLNQVPVLDE